VSGDEGSDESAAAGRIRRQPPEFEPVTVLRVDTRSAYLRRITLHGPSLTGFVPPLPAGSVRLLLPDSLGAELRLPIWTGNEFRHGDGRRPVIRTLTPLRHDAAAGELDVEVVLHGGGPLARWAVEARGGEAAALSGPGRGWELPADLGSLMVIGDESAIPAIGQVLDAVSASAAVRTTIEIGHPDASVPLGLRPVDWVIRPAGDAPGSALVRAVTSSDLAEDVTVWAAGEAGAMQRIRRHLFERVGLARRRATVRGYWKHGREGVGDG
jgi:NADPH-dependent ferric siderophore reductase